MSPRPERLAAKKMEDATDLPPIPENSEAVLRSRRLRRQYDEEDAEDREEQGLFERDNAASSSVDVYADAFQTNNGVVDGSDNSDWGGIPLMNAANDNGGNYVNDEKSTTQAQSVDPGPFYIQSSSSADGEKWELTWPIWHMLPRNERRAIAAQHGYKTIGDFEEYMSLTRAVDESEGTNGGVTAGAGAVQARGRSDSDGGSANSHDVAVNTLASGLEGVSWDDDSHADKELERLKEVDFSDKLAHFKKDDEEEDEDEHDESSISSTDRETTKSTTNQSKRLTTASIDTDLQTHLEAIQNGGLPCLLPDEILHKTFAYLPIDDHASLALVSSHWSRFTRSESLYKLLCQRIYLRQSKRKTLHVSRFQHSYRRMLEIRPRVRTGGGLYVLKYAEVRKIQRDMWTEIPVGAILESVYYRYLYFFEDGRVMYALTHASPVEMIPRFVKMVLKGYGSKDKWGVWGRYEIQKDEVRVWAAQAWQDVCFQLRVLPSNRIFHYDNGDRGVWTTLALEKHMASGTGDFREHSSDLVHFEIPENRYFRFLRDRRI
mmetsp:Transcript_26299/g.54009  ORF Transcript_26299/g.54009 Transcript_26299/m.54009 type:complete len:546 (-) Transcript_26299:275-1912(-)